MKMMTVLMVLFTSAMSFAQIMPESATQGMSADQAVVSCTFDNKDVDYTELKINSAGDMILTVNAKYVSGDIAPYILYKGLDIGMTSVDSAVTVKGVILSLTGEVVIDLVLARGQSNSVVVAEEALTCEVM